MLPGCPALPMRSGGIWAWALSDNIDQIIFIGDCRRQRPAQMTFAGLNTYAGLTEITLTQANKVKGPMRHLEGVYRVGGRPTRNGLGRPERRCQRGRVSAVG